MSEPIIRVRGLAKQYPRFALRDVTFEVGEGRVLGLIGPNGAGKSTLLRILMGLVRPDAGEATVLGWPMPASERAVKLRTGFVSEDMALYGAATLRWHMDLVRAMYPDWDELRARDLTARFGLDPAQRVRDLSRGQQVKALLLLATARHAELLLLDEPTAGLDPLARNDLLTLLTESRGERRGAIFSSHIGADVAALADDVAFLFEGRIVAYGPVAEFVEGGRTLERAFLDHAARTRDGRAA